MRVEVVPGTPIRMASGTAKARLSLIVADAFGRPVGVTARYFLESADNPQVFSITTGAQIGERFQTVHVTELDSSEDIPPLFEAIGVLRLGEDVAWTDNPTAIVLDPDELVGARVMFVTGNSEEVVGHVIGYGGALRLTTACGDRSVIYKQPLTIHVAEGYHSLLAGGSGALVLDGDGRAAAILISQDEERWYAAPLAPFMDRHGLVLPEPSDLRAVDAAAFGNTITEEAEKLRDALAALRQDLSSRSTFHSDPEGNSVPAELQSLLEDL